MLFRLFPRFQTKNRIISARVNISYCFSFGQSIQAELPAGEAQSLRGCCFFIIIIIVIFYPSVRSALQFKRQAETTRTRWKFNR